MVVACSPDIFHAKMSELMATLEFMLTYLDDKLCISKGNLDDHLAKLQRVLNQLQNVGLGHLQPRSPYLQLLLHLCSTLTLLFLKR